MRISNRIESFNDEAQAFLAILKAFSIDSERLKLVERFCEARSAELPLDPISTAQSKNLIFDRIGFYRLIWLILGWDKGIQRDAIDLFLERLVSFGILSTFYDGRFMFETTALIGYYRLNVLDNIIFGREHIVKKYSQSVFAILIEKDGVESIGTAFLSSLFTDGEPSFLVTARHNVDPCFGITVKKIMSRDGTEFKTHEIAWTMSDKADIACLKLSDAAEIPIIHLCGAPKILQWTLSLGYPPVSTADSSYLLAHSGEINAEIKTYFNQKFLLVSNQVAPGSSGGPLLDEQGYCVGMVVNSLERKLIDGRVSFNAAVHVDELVQLLRSASEL